MRTTRTNTPVAADDTPPGPDELTNACNRYYKLTEQLLTREATLQNLLDGAQLYIGQTDIEEIDAIINHHREVAAAQSEVNETLDGISNTGHTIQKLMKLAGIPGGAELTGRIPYQLEYTISSYDKTGLRISKTKDLDPEPEDPNLIIIKCTDGSVMQVEICLTGFLPVSSETMVDMCSNWRGLLSGQLDQQN